MDYLSACSKTSFIVVLYHMNYLLPLLSSFNPTIMWQQRRQYDVTIIVYTVLFLSYYLRWKILWIIY